MLEKNSPPYLARTASPPRPAPAVPGFGPRLPGVLLISATVSCSSLERLISGGEARCYEVTLISIGDLQDEISDKIISQIISHCATHQAVRSRAQRATLRSRTILRPDCHRVV